MRSKPTFLRIHPAFTLILLLICLCNYTALDTGGSSGTEISKVSGSVVDENGNAVSGALVQLRPADYLADSANDSTYVINHIILDRKTDSDGSFVFPAVKTDNYVIESTVDDSLGASVQLYIDCEHPETTLTPLSVAPMARVTGNAKAYYSQNTDISVQVYGSERSTTTDSLGDFDLRVPYGRHNIHFAAYTSYNSHTEEFDTYDIIFQVTPGEERDAGSIRLRPLPPPPCTTGACDSQTVRYILDRNGYNDVPLDSVSVTENGRITELSLHGFNLSDNLPFEIYRLPALRLLDLGATGLTSLFRDIGSLSELEIVRLDQNNIADISKSIGECKKLRELDLHDNQIICLPFSITDCTALETLNVADNHLCFVDSTLAEWLDRNDPDWQDDQSCRW